MIFWSIVPLDEVLAGYDDPSLAPELQVMRIRGVELLAEVVAPGSIRIHRLLSPLPSDYLDPRLAPGQVIESDWT